MMETTAPRSARLDVLVSEWCDISRSAAAKHITEGRCTVDGKVQQKAGFAVPEGASLQIELPEPAPSEAQPENIPLHILYEDADLAIVEKPCGMVVHPAAGNESGTLVNALLYHLHDLSGVGGVLRPGIVHRLDKDTSGLMMIAKNDETHIALSAQLSERLTEKHYLAVVEGAMKEPSGLIDRPIARSKQDRKKMAIDEDGRPAQTEWTVLTPLRQATLLDVHILTGRTHQIRVHMRSVGHPVAGDPIYGAKNGVRVPRLMLHAHTLTFTHPRTGERMRFTCEPPEAFRKAVEALSL